LEKYPVLENYYNEKEVTLYKGKGCSTCSQRGYKQEEVGYKGRVAIFEIINSTPELKELILTNPSSRQIWELAKSQGARSLFDDGIGKVRSGLTTIDELLRVAMPPEIVNLVKTKKNGTKKETAKKKKA
jgi:type IV pilus assembly protein PilB